MNPYKEFSKSITDFIASKEWPEFDKVDAFIDSVCRIAYRCMTVEQLKAKCDAIYALLDVCTKWNQKAVEENQKLYEKYEKNISK